MLEKDFQNIVVQYLNLKGWKVCHFGKATVRANKSITPVKYQGKGYPDLTAVHPKKGLMFVEVKTDKGVVSSYQQEWLDLLGMFAMAVVVRPKTFEEFKKLV